ncbi:unnamed protein product, partial [Arabidopsis halleri]
MKNPPDPEGTSQPVAEAQNPPDAEDPNSPPPYFKTLIGPKNSYTIKSILKVESIIHGDEDGELEDYSWGEDETGDVAVEYMSRMIKEGHKFKKEDWHDGVENQPLITACLRTKAEKLTAKQKGKAKCKPKMKTKPQGEGKSDGGECSKIPVENLTAEYIFREVERRNYEHSLKVHQMNYEHSLKVQQMIFLDRKTMRDEVVNAVVDAVFKCLREKG